MSSRPFGPRRQRRDDLLPLLYAFVYAFADVRTWNESRQLLEQHPELLDEEVDVLLDGIAAEARQQANQSLASEVEQVRAFLQRCRAAGVNVAFEEAMTTEEPVADSLTSAFVRLLEAFRRPSTWPDARLVIRQHPELLDQEFDALLGSWIAAARDEGDDAAVGLFEVQRDLLRRCRELGVEAAFFAIARESAFRFPPEDEWLVELFRTFFSASEGSESTRLHEQQLLEQHPELLSEAADDILNEMAAVAREQAEDRLSLVYEFYRRLLRRCREIGIAAAFAELASDNSFESSELGLLSQRALESHEQYISSGDLEVLQAAVATWQRVLAHPDFGSAAPWYGSRILNNIGNALLSRFEAMHDVADLDAALERWSQARVLAARGSVERALILRNLGSGYVTRYSHAGDPGDLELGIQAGQEAVAEIPGDSSYVPTVLVLLGTALTARFNRTDEPGDLERAVDLLQEAVTITAGGSQLEGSEFRRSALNALGKALFSRYQAAGRLEDLDAALEYWGEAVAHPSTGNEFQLPLLDQLGAGYLARYIQTGNPDDLERAIQTHEETLAGGGLRSSPNEPGYQVNLGNALRVRYDRTGNLSDLERAIEMLGEDVARTPRGSPTLPIVLVSLGGALRTRHERTADLNDLERSIAAFEEAVNSTPPSSPHRPIGLTGLGDSLRDRYRRTGQLDDLDQAIDVLRQAATQAPADSPDRILCLTGLGNALRDRYAHNGQLDDLEQAIEAFEHVVAQTQPGSPRRPLFLTNLGNAFRDRYRDSGQLDDLERALSVFEQSVTQTQASSPDLPPNLNNLGAGLLERFERTGQPDDLRRALDALESAVAGAPADSPLMPGYLNNLAHALRSRYESTGDPDDLQRAVEAFRRSCRRGLDVSALWELGVARGWGAWAAQRGSWDEAVEAYGFASTAMQFLFRIQLTRSHREAWLREAIGLPSRAAYALAMGGHLEGAVLALDEGRALLLSDALDRDRIELKGLSAHDRPDLRDRYLKAADRLRALDQASLGSDGPTLIPTAVR